MPSIHQPTGPNQCVAGVPQSGPVGDDMLLPLVVDGDGAVGDCEVRLECVWLHTMRVARVAGMT